MFLDQIVKSSKSSRELIEGILLFASADQPAELEEKVDLNEQVKAAIEAHSLSIKNKKAEFNVEQLPVVEKGISVKVYQLFYNLIGNALKFHKPNDIPKISIHMNENSEIVIEDNGIGFDQEHAVEIFKPLKRIEGNVNYEGYGIGLGTCQRIAEFHGWGIRGEGELGKGAKFIITI